MTKHCAKRRVLLAALASLALPGCSLLFSESSATDAAVAADAPLLDGALLDGAVEDSRRADAACTGTCPASYVRGYACLCYKAYAAPATFVDARQFCRTPTEGNLVVIDSLEKNTWVTSFIAMTVNTQSWIGLSYNLVDNEWRWVDDSLLEAGDYDAFNGSGPPSPPLPRCVKMIGGVWADEDCGELYAYVCQAPPV